MARIEFIILGVIILGVVIYLVKRLVYDTGASSNPPSNPPPPLPVAFQITPLWTSTDTDPFPVGGSSRPFIHCTKNNTSYLAWVDSGYHPKVSQVQENADGTVSVQEYLIDDCHLLTSSFAPKSNCQYTSNDNPYPDNSEYTVWPDAHHGRFALGMDELGYLHFTGDMHWFSDSTSAPLCAEIDACNIANPNNQRSAYPDLCQDLDTYWGTNSPNVHTCNSCLSPPCALVTKTYVGEVPRHLARNVKYWRSNLPYDVTGGFTQLGKPTFKGSRVYTGIRSPEGNLEYPYLGPAGRVQTNTDEATRFELQGLNYTEPNLEITVQGKSTALPGNGWMFGYFFNDNDNKLYYTSNVFADAFDLVRSGIDVGQAIGIGLYSYDTGSQIWTAIGNVDPVLDKDALGGYYVNRRYKVFFDEYDNINYFPQFQFDQNNILHFAATARSIPSQANIPGMRNRLIYAYSPDKGATWLRKDGSQITLPMLGGLMSAPDGAPVGPDPSRVGDVVADLSELGYDPTVYMMSQQVSLVVDSQGTVAIYADIRNIATNNPENIYWYVYDDNQGKWVYSGTPATINLNSAEQNGFPFTNKYMGSDFLFIKDSAVRLNTGQTFNQPLSAYTTEQGLNLDSYGSQTIRDTGMIYAEGPQSGDPNVTHSIYKLVGVDSA